MKRCICDTCKKSNDDFRKMRNSSREISQDWITMKLDYYYNDTKSDNIKLISCGNMQKEVQFCCKECMVKYFFID